VLGGVLKEGMGISVHLLLLITVTTDWVRYKEKSFAWLTVLVQG
jgi:hypothetical protein